MRYTGPKFKKARRLGFSFTDKDAKLLPKNSAVPGVHGASKSRLSEYGVQLREKQRCKVLYGVLEKQFRLYYGKARQTAGVTGDNLINLLERRLDNLVYRSGFATSRAQARQLVSHGFFEVNGKKVNIPSYSVKVGDIVTLRGTKVNSKYMLTRKEALKSYKTLDFLDFNTQKLAFKLVTEPTPEMVGNQINTQLIIEHFSR